ncbi:MAG TPA: peptidoglycan endopeptidase, partial [Micromonosporaceae bacterium]
MGRIRTRQGALRKLLIVAAAAVVGVLPSAPAHAEPSIPEVEKQIDQAWVKLEPVIEQYNKVHSQLKASQKTAADLT